jgi:hypothetical protein
LKRPLLVHFARPVTDGAIHYRLGLREQPRALTPEEREAWLDWLYEIAGQASRDPSWLESTSKADFKKAVLEQIVLASTVPGVTALYGTGGCLWISGFSPSDYVMGTSHTWVIVNVARAEVVAVVRVTRRGSRIRTVDPGAIYSTYRDSLGVFNLERWPTQLGPECS